MRLRIYSILALLGILASACGAGASPAEYMPPEVVVSLSRPATGETYPRWSPIPVTATSQTSEAVRALELWVDGSLEASVVPDSSLTRWEWVAAEAGAHTLLARAVTESGATAFSNKVTIFVSEEAAQMTRLLRAAEGDTVESLAAAASVSPEDLVTLNPGLVAGQPIAPETPVKVPHASGLEGVQLAPPPPAPEVQPGTTLPAQPYVVPGFFTNLGALFGTNTPPAAPSIGATAQGCTAQLVILDQADNEDGYRIYRLDSSTPVFAAVAEVAAGDGTLPLLHTDFDLSGAVNYYVTAFNSAGESAPSNLAGVNITSSACQSAFWEAAGGFGQPDPGGPGGGGGGGNATNFDVLIPPTYDQVYFYLSLNDGPWSRVPRFENEFLTPANGFFSLDALLEGAVTPPAAGTLKVNVDAWGWSGGMLAYIGAFERTYEAPENQQPFAVFPGQLELCDIQKCGEFGQYGLEWTGDGGAHNLRWTPGPGTTAGLWQVSRSPFEAGCELEPAGVFLSGFLQAQYETQVFTVEFPNAGEDDYSIPIPQPGGGPSISVSGAALPQVYYTRILPLFNGQPTCDPTNMVVLHVQEPPQVELVAPPSAPTPPLPYSVDIVEFTPIHFPDYAFRYCVTITENPYYGQDPFNLIEQGHYLESGWTDVPVGQDICPAPYVYEEPGILEQIGDFLKEALNTISFMYAALKQLVIDIVAHLLPLCAEANLAAELGSETGEALKEELESYCGTAAEIAVNAAMTYVGLPPSIPNYDQVMETAKGQATEIIAQQFEEQTGLPCIDACRDLIRQALDQMQETIEDEFSDSACVGELEAHDNGIEPMCLPDFIKSAPMREGTLEPALVKVIVTRNADVPDSAFPNPEEFSTDCRLRVVTFAENDSWVGQEVFVGSDYQTGALQYWTGTTLSGAPFQSIYGGTPVLAPGESAELTFALNVKRGTYPPGVDGFWLPGRLAIIQDHVNGSQLQNYYGTHYDDWNYLYFGAQLTVTAVVTCTTAADGYTPSQSEASDVWVEQIQSEP
jgi:hypothetical protein